jgi:protein TonB
MVQESHVPYPTDKGQTTSWQHQAIASRRGPELARLLDAAYASASHETMATREDLGLRSRTAGAVGLSCALHLGLAGTLLFVRQKEAARPARPELTAVEVTVAPRPPELVRPGPASSPVVARRHAGKRQESRTLSSSRAPDGRAAAASPIVATDPVVSPEIVVVRETPAVPQSESVPSSALAPPNSTSASVRGRGLSDEVGDSDLGHGKPGDADWESIRASTYRQLRYPAVARRLGWAGQVVLRFRVDAAGQVSSEAIMVSSGFALLDESALDALKRAAPFPVRGPDLEVILPVVFALH